MVDRQPGAALETSFANGGQISASYAEPWANPDAPLQDPASGWARRTRRCCSGCALDWRQWLWGLQFLLECLPSRTRHNTIQCLQPRAVFARLPEGAARETGIAYDQLARGILHVLHRRAGIRRTASRPPTSCAVRLRPRRQDAPTNASRSSRRSRTCRDAPRRRHLHGDRRAGRRAASSPRARAARGRARRALSLRHARRLAHRRRRRDRAACAASTRSDAHGDRCAADGYVAGARQLQPAPARGRSASRAIVYPAKGYSATISVGEHQRRADGVADRPRVEDRDDAPRRPPARRRAPPSSPAGHRLNRLRCEALARRTFELFPDAGDRASVQFWAGLRPATPANVPLIGRTRYRNLWLDTGHGTLGWTMACGSGSALPTSSPGASPRFDSPSRRRS